LKTLLQQYFDSILGEKNNLEVKKLKFRFIFFKLSKKRTARCCCWIL